MSRCTEPLKHRGTSVASLTALIVACFCMRADAAAENAAQNGATWVLHEPHSELANSYDPRRDAEKDLAAAGQEARKSDRNIFVIVGGDWCSWCHIMDQFFHEHPELEALRAKNYVVMKVNMSQENPNKAFLSRFPKIRAYPHIFILAASGTLIRSQGTGDLEGGKSYNAELFGKFLKQFAPKTGQ
jgi:thiol:disulfide interchange protein